MHLVAVVGLPQEASGARLATFLNERDTPLIQHHTSGHASVEDLRRLADALHPERVVPIHTFGGNSYGDLHTIIDVQPDGQWWDV